MSLCALQQSFLRNGFDEHIGQTDGARALGAQDNEFLRAPSTLSAKAVLLPVEVLRVGPIFASELGFGLARAPADATAEG